MEAIKVVIEQAAGKQKKKNAGQKREEHSRVWKPDEASNVS